MQSIWRKTGLWCIGIAGVMALLGVYGMQWDSVWLFIVYWGVVFVLLMIAVYTALLDLRYTRAQYAVAKRAAYLETLGDATLRQALESARRPDQPPSESPPPSTS